MSTAPTGTVRRPSPVTAAVLLLAAGALVAVVYGVVNNRAQELVAALALGLVAWGVWLGHDLARVILWLFTGLALVSLAVRIANVVQGPTWTPVLASAGDLATLVAAVLIGQPRARDFFLARRRPLRSAAVEDLDD